MLAPGHQDPPLPALRLGNLTVAARSFDGGSIDLVRGVSLSCRPGAITALIGESGSGKSLTASACLGLLDPSIYQVAADELVVAGVTAAQPSAAALAPVRGKKTGYVMQDPGTALDPTMTVGDQIAELFVLHRGQSWSAARREAVRMLDRVRIPKAAERARDYPHSFSGGMRQRAVIAGAVALDPLLLVADEPTTALDVTVQAEILALIDELRSEIGMGVLLITHDLAVVYQIADHVDVMYAGRIVESGPAETLCLSPSHPYTFGLLASVPDLSRPRGAMAAIPGNPPNPAKVGAGCSFAPRCDRAEVLCRQQLPEIRTTRTPLRARCFFPVEGPVGAYFEASVERPVDVPVGLSAKVAAASWVEIPVKDPAGLPIPAELPNNVSTAAPLESPVEVSVRFNGEDTAT